MGLSDLLIPLALIFAFAVGVAGIFIAIVFMLDSL